MPNFIEQLDAKFVQLLSDWTVITTVLAVLTVGTLLYPIVFPNEADTHPLLLARQSIVAPIRKKHESAAYRSPEVPYGFPLRTGLDVKAADAPRWAPGKDGDLRDVWREVQRGGSLGVDGKEIPKGLIMTVLGKEEVVKHEIPALSKEIQILGKRLNHSGGRRVAVYLPNSIEYLLTIFASAFYGLTPVLIPFNLPHPKLYELIKQGEADCLICAAGSVPLEDLSQECPKLGLLIWVVEKTSRHMDWHGVPESAQDRLNVGVWHDVVEENRANATADLPSNDSRDRPEGVVFVWQDVQKLNVRPTLATFTQQNLVAATSALVHAIPLRQRLSRSDLVLPASSFHIPYVLCQTLGALFQHASLAITSVAEPGVDLALVQGGVCPTIIIASPETMARLHDEETSRITNALHRIGMANQTRALNAGRMPKPNFLFKLVRPSASCETSSQLRLIFTCERLGGGSPPLTSAMLSDLRIFTNSRICYALTAPQVAGAVAQTNVYDYRREDESKMGHFGQPLSSVEIKLTGREENGTLNTNQPEGEIMVSGPAVSGGGEVRLGVKGRFRLDGTLAVL